MRIALLQMTSGIDPIRNAALIEAAIHEAADGGAAMLFTPEMCGMLDRDRERSQAVLRDEVDDVVLAAATRAARETGLWVSLGSLAIAGAQGDKRRNRSFVIDGAGGVKARYDKVHLFDVDLPGGQSWRESAVYEAGSEAVLLQTPLGRLGLTICYDVRFPVLFSALAQSGAEIITVPAAFTVPTGAAHWHVLLRARAIETQCFIIAAAQTSEHEDGRATYGHSLVIDPWGQVLLDAGEAPGLYFCDVDLAQLADVRGRIPVQSHRHRIGEPVLA